MSLPVRPIQRMRGFTLVEVLVALAIVGVALLAGLKATGALTLHAQRQSDVLLGQLCAENALHQIRLARQMPGVGEASRECVQAGQTFTLLLNVQPTPNPNEPVLRLSTIVGRN